MVFDSSLLKRPSLLRLGIRHAAGNRPAGKLGIQAIVNTMGVSVALAAFAVVNRIDDFAYTGAEYRPRHDRADGTEQRRRQKGPDAGRFRCGLVLETIYGIAVFIVCFVFRRHLMMLFVKDEEVIMHGVTYLHLISVCTFSRHLPTVSRASSGGIGDLKITLISSFINMGVRVLAAAPLVLIMHLGIEGLPFSYLASWVGMLVAEFYRC